MTVNNRRRGFTLMSVIIAIVVIGILATMMMYASNEMIATARAAKILANLETFRKAAIAWYMDNRDKVQPNGTVKIGNTAQPVQQWTDEDLKISSYISGAGDAKIQFTKYSGMNSDLGRGITKMQPGDYGLYDGGTETRANGVKDNGETNWEKTAWHRNAWYVGYYFKDGEEKVKEKIKKRAQSTGIFFGTTDVHEDNVHDAVAVWLRVF